MKTKYIIVRAEDGFKSAILFPITVIHKDVARIHRVGEIYVESAGFVNMDDLSVYGGSESLKMNSRPEDSAIIKQGFVPREYE